MHEILINYYKKWNYIVLLEVSNIKSNESNNCIEYIYKLCFVDFLQYKYYLTHFYILSVLVSKVNCVRFITSKINLVLDKEKAI